MQRLGLVALTIGAILSAPALAADGKDAPPDQIARPAPLILRGGGADQSGLPASGNVPDVTRGTPPNPGPVFSS